jgi:DNA polymerase-3 subunit epsilon
VAAGGGGSRANDNGAVQSPDTVAVIDFETTGMSPAMGARATEIAAVLVREGRIVGRFASLMRSGVRVPPFIEQLTGISNRMLAGAPPAAEVMAEVAEFTRGCGVVAHNAAFDRAFWRHERALAWSATAAGQADHACAGEPAEFACTLLLARRLYPEAPNHKLGTLVSFHGITPTGRAHRALADAEVTAELWLRITRDVQRRYAAETPFGLLCALQRTPRAGLARCAERYFRNPAA